MSKFSEYDAVFSADSTEWCPYPGRENLLAVGTYQVDKSESETFSAQQRKGRLLLMSVDSDCKLELVQQEDYAPILDLKWSPHLINGQAILASADAQGRLSTLSLSEGEAKLTNFDNVKISPDGLVLSLDWSTRKNNDTQPKIASSCSKGTIHVCHWTEYKLAEVISVKKHDFEAWITAFDAFDSNVIYSGGDDSRLKGFDTRCPQTNTFVSKEHEAGVTSLLSCVQTGNLFSGSYDEHLCQWDKRSFKLPISKKRFGGGIWRIKQHPRNPEILALACMDNGFKVVDRDDFTEICHYTEHQSLAYGVDWKYCNENVLASCSFYDHYLTCWTFPHKEK